MALPPIEVLAVGAAGLVPLLWIAWRVIRRDRILREVARRVGGRVRFTTLELEVDGVRAEVFGFSDRETRIRFDAPVSCWLEIRTRTWFEQILRFFGQRIRTGDREFDGWFSVRAESPEWALAALDASTRRRIRRLGLLGAEGETFGFDLVANGSAVAISCPRDLLQHPAHLVRFIQTSVAVYSDLKGLPAGSVRVLSLSEKQGVCPVCSGPAGEEALRCDRCRTPHHPECWRYLGHCATFGCDRPIQAA